MRQRTKQEMYPMVESWQTSGKSRTDFCTEQQVKIHTFNYWLAKYQKEMNGEALQSGKPSKFIALELSGSKSNELEVHYPNGVRLSLKGGLSIDQLAALIRIGTNV